MELRPEYKQTEVGVIPEDWDEQNLGSLAQVIGGGAFKSRNATRTGIRWLKIANVGINEIIWNEESFLPKEFELSNRNFLLKEVDYVLALTRPILSGLLKISRVQKQDAPALLNQRVGKLESIEDNDLDFLYFLFQKESTVFAMQQSMAGTDPPNLSTKGIYSIPCIIPKKKVEQRAIAAALSDVDALLAKLDQLIAKKRDLKLAAMQQLLSGKKRLPEFQVKSSYKQSEVGVIPEDWDVRKLRSIVRSHNSGIYKSQELYGHGCNIVGVSDIYGIEKVSGQFFAAVPLSSKERTKHKLQCNDLLYGESSLVREGIARTVHVTEQGAGTAFAWHTRRYSIDQRTLLSPYLYYYLQSPTARAHMINNSIQTAITGINTIAYFACPIIVPPLPEQSAIATILSDMDAEIAALEARRDKTKDLKQGMMQELLTGRIRLL
jgi:type I restriction enzyme S subunit